ncbi:Glycosidase [Geodermatophilus telluris]|uniref:Glycosidase n=1 Tax=Geodermatophilus telluris TaxID=1190417 RepID=A0A1G6QAY4_9ACTN|nr:alpha-amylase family glycosyl hydrolase [Geodermatophilus telluris]SDC88817.1 Glycosidase [Geodermatophilus telluris]
MERLTSTGQARSVAARAQAGTGSWPSPVDWRDEVLYFLLPDRFSDGGEAGRPLLTRQEVRDLRSRVDRDGWSWQRWAESGGRWQGGTLDGVRGRLDYLRGLGVTALWIGPVFRQRAHLDTYHGYGIQDFLDVDPRFGTRQDLVDLVAAAHGHGLRVVLDVIVNHSGDNWAYVPPGHDLDAETVRPPYLPWPGHYTDPASGEGRDWRLAWRDSAGRPATVDGDAVDEADDGVWPEELRHPGCYTRAGCGVLGAGSIADPHAEHKRTDFLTLKDFALDTGDVLAELVACYRYWIALTDCDGFRIDTVKHMALEEARAFCGAIREYADSLGKRNFLLVGEIAGGDDQQDFVLDHLAVLQHNLGAALDIGSARLALTAVGKGLVPGAEYLSGFDAASQGFGSHRSLGDRHVSVLDDHDHVFGAKLRFSAEIPDDSPVKDHQVCAATAVQLFTLGIPCVYYGTEQAFAGPAHSQLEHLREEGWGSADRYLREAMFGPEHPRAAHTEPLATQVAEVDASLPGFGPFGTSGRHAFDPDSPAYVRIAALCAVRAAHPALRIGRQYPRPLRLPGRGFELPPAGELVAWSRVLDVQEAVVAVNPNGTAARGGDVVVAAELAPPGSRYEVVANTAQAADPAGYRGPHRVGDRLPVRGRTAPGEPAYVEVRDVPPAEVVVLVRVG